MSNKGIVSQHDSRRNRRLVEKGLMPPPKYIYNLKEAIRRAGL